MTGRAALEKIGPPVAHPAAEKVRALTPDELERAIREVAPDAFLVEPRILRRVVRQDRGVGLLGRQAGGRRSYAIDGARALAFLDRDELGLPPDAPMPAMLILIARPDPGELASRTADQSLQDAWRLLAHAGVQASLKRRVTAGTLDRAAVNRRIDRIGQAEFDEIRAVLREDHYLQDTRDVILSYVEFAALYAELRYFAPEALARHFPSLGPPGRIDAILGEDLDVPGLLARCRPADAPDLPGPNYLTAEDEDEPAEDAVSEAEDAEMEPWVRTRWLYRFLIDRARNAAGRRNYMRAAVRRMRAARFAPEDRAEATREAARRELERLAQQLGPALRLSDAEVAQWRRALPPLAARAGRGVWSREARLLFDLQKVALDHGREIYTVDLVEWALSLGELVAGQIEPFKPNDPSRLDVAGPRFMLNAQSAQILGMALHELSTNAVKYGAFAEETGTLAVHWSSDGARLHLVWREHVTTRRRRSTRTGFGTTVLNSMVGGALGAEVQRTLHRDGIEWRFAIPLPVLDPKRDLDQPVAADAAASGADEAV